VCVAVCKSHVLQCVCCSACCSVCVVVCVAYLSPTWHTRTKPAFTNVLHSYPHCTTQINTRVRTRTHTHIHTHTHTHTHTHKHTHAHTHTYTTPKQTAVQLLETTNETVANMSPSPDWVQVDPLFLLFVLELEEVAAMEWLRLAGSLKS